MPEFRGRKSDNARVLAKASKRWKILNLLDTSVDDDGLAELVLRIPALEEISISSEIISDRGIESLCSLPQLGSLLLHHAPSVTDASMPAVGRLSELRELYLEDTQLTDSGLSELLTLKNVWSLILAGTRVTDAGVSRLGTLNKIRILSLNATNITGEGLSGIYDTERLSLYLEYCPINDNALLKYLKTHPRLERLSLISTGVTDESMPALADLPQLLDLRLDNTAVTNAGISHFVGHPRITSLYLEGTQVTEECLQRLRDNSPHDLLLTPRKRMSD